MHAKEKRLCWINSWRFFYKTLQQRYDLIFSLFNSHLMASPYKSIFCSVSAKCPHLLVRTLKLQSTVFEDGLFLEDKQMGDSSVRFTAKSRAPLSLLPGNSFVWKLGIWVYHSREPGIWDWGLGTHFSGSRKSNSHQKSISQLLRAWGFFGFFEGFVFLLLLFGWFWFLNLSVYYVTFFRNAITSKQNEHSDFLCYTDFEAM